MEATGVWASEVEAIRQSSIVEGRVDSSGNLVLKNGAGAEFNAGKVVVPLAGYPVGSLFIHTTPTDPAVLLGGGTWARFAQGRTLVSQYDLWPEFDTALEEIGERYVSLTGAQNGPHSHTVTDPGHDHSMRSNSALLYQQGTTGPATVMGGTYEGEITSSNTSDITIDSSGSGEGHLNIQPSIVVYMWRRTA